MHKFDCRVIELDTSVVFEKGRNLSVNEILNVPNSIDGVRKSVRWNIWQ
jgi:hypothetical protein